MEGVEGVKGMGGGGRGRGGWQKTRGAGRIL